MLLSCSGKDYSQLKREDWFPVGGCDVSITSPSASLTGWRWTRPDMIHWTHQCFPLWLWRLNKILNGCYFVLCCIVHLVHTSSMLFFLVLWREWIKMEMWVCLYGIVGIVFIIQFSSCIALLNRPTCVLWPCVVIYVFIWRNNKTSNQPITRYHIYWLS